MIKEHYKCIDSTQLEIWRRINNNNIQNMTLITADLQTQGKGTHGRKWYTNKENNIAFSLYLEANCSINKLNGITIEIAEIILEIFRKMYNIELQIKKPNDIVYNNKKIGGILTETSIIGENVKYLIIGIGINTNCTDFDKEIENIATSIKNEFNIYVDNQKVISEFCNICEKQIQERIGENI